MKRENVHRYAVLLALAGGLMNFLASTNRFYFEFAGYLITLCGIVVPIAAVFLFKNPVHSKFWGTIIFLYSTIGFLGFALAENTRLLSFALLALVLGTIGGALAISEEK